jgi:hypothetical protein
MAIGFTGGLLALLVWPSFGDGRDHLEANYARRARRLYKRGREIAAEVPEMASDLVAEVQAERADKRAKWPLAVAEDSTDATTPIAGAASS